MAENKQYHNSTALVHKGRRHLVSNVVNVPPYRGSTVLFPDTEALQQSAQLTKDDFRYGRKGSPTHVALQEQLCAISGAEDCQLHPSGLAAIWNALVSFMKPGGLILACDNVYGPARAALKDIAKKFQGSVIFHPGTEPPSRAELPTPPCIIYCESPGSLTFEIQNLKAWVQLAKEVDAISMIDNTWATPLGLDSLGIGFDVDIQALTKYPSGHSDVLMGATLTNSSHGQVITRHIHLSGVHVGPDDIYFVSRGLRTMASRLETQTAASTKIASWLQDHESVAAVFHPCLTTHPQHHYYQEYFTGGSGLFSIQLHQHHSKATNTFIDRLELFGIGYSWGGFESLAIPVYASTLDHRSQNNFPGDLIRLHIGLENIQDLCGDLEQALS